MAFWGVLKKNQINTNNNTLFSSYTPIILHANLSTITSKVLIRNKQVLIVLREGTFFLGGGGRAGKFWYFFQKKVLALPHVLIKKTPDPPLLGD